MTVQAFRLINFMAFEDSGWIELRPITLLFGRNSSGKSVITRALRFLKQSTGRDANPFRFYDEKGVDLESFANIIHGNLVKDAENKQVPLTFKFRCEIASLASSIFKILKENSKKSARILTEKTKYPVELSLSYTAKPDSDYPQLSNLMISIVSRPGGLLFQAALNTDEEREITGDVWTFSTDLLHGHERGKKPTIWTRVSVESNQGFLPELIYPDNRSEFIPDSVRDLQIVNDILKTMAQDITDFLKNIRCVNAVRPEPQRSYALHEHDWEKWEASGFGSFYRYLTVKASTEDYDRVDALVRHMEIGQKVDISHFEHAGIHSTSLKINDGLGNERSLVDLGYGISQVLPILIETVLLEHNSLSIIDQPELNLHPRAQANLADALVDGVQRSADPNFPGRPQIKPGRLLIETHSQYIVLRLLRRIRDTYRDQLDQNLKELILDDITPEFISIYAIDRPEGTHTSNIRPITVSSTGEFSTPWPNGFFPESFNEMIATGE